MRHFYEIRLYFTISKTTVNNNNQFRQNTIHQQLASNKENKLAMSLKIPTFAK